ncbi:flavodoxin domain-containing protein [uncultured Olegusella sp.]|uniref:flavodoxin domain-containing protein n=1 Tax=uncultured Olegusella sp. TaxID=1979846 RepID=UPI00260FCB6E|nr:flavodoxin domain-containing protein [uncultured Olegusella sp.]
MSKLAVVYWTMTGNTEAMAQAVADGATDADVIAVADFSADRVADYDAFAFGCPAMGAEELDTDEFEPVWDECCPEFGDKPVGLFGSYDWGTGEWMETWKSHAEEAGVQVIDTVIANLEPDDDAIEALKNLGAKLSA